MSNEDQKQKVEARAPRGLADREAGELAATGRMLDVIRSVYELYGFEALETPAIEYTDALGKFLPDQDRPNEGVFSFQDDDEQWLSLRYDLTAPLARFVAQNYDRIPKPYRSYRCGPVYRNEKPGPGRFRQFMQFDADTVGSASPAADAEICMMAADAMEKLGIKRGDYLIKVNNRKILDGVMDSLGLSGEENAARRLTVLRAIDKLDRLGWEGVSQLLGAGRKDESGDFTKGAQLREDQIDRFMSFIGLQAGYAQLHDVTGVPPISDSAKGIDYTFTSAGPGGQARFRESNGLMLEYLREQFGKNEIVRAGIDELAHINDLVEASGYGYDRIRIDPSVVRGLEYYTGPVYEAELTFETKDEKGNPVRFGSVGGGGRYDGLIARFRSEPVPATGFSIGVSRLLAALRMLKKIDDKPEFGPVVVTIFDKDRIADYQALVKELREAGIRAELYLGNPKNFGNQTKYADRRNSPAAVIQGGDELARGEVQIKDLIDGKKAAEMIASNTEWRASRPAQFSVPREKLIETVQEVLKRHGIH